MALSCFADNSRPPDAAELAAALGPAAALWGELRRRAEAAHGPLQEEWKHPGKSFGWSLRLKLKERVLLYLTPQQGFLWAGIVLGERASAAALADAGLPPALRQTLADSKAYAEGRGLRLELRPGAELEPLLRLLDHKLA
ncbi:MAG: DUF3788 family protein [Candidatus Delongbacteria bacterium]